jgi:hypothetical protein
MRLSLTTARPVCNRLLWSVTAICVLTATPAFAQAELFGGERDAARAAIIYPVVFDPLLMLPLTPGPQAVLDVHGADAAATAHIALRNGDDSYGILASAPVGTGDTSTSVDPRGMRRHASLGFHLTNLIWHPKNTESAPWALFIHADYRFNRAEYEFVDAPTLQRRTDTRLNDTASMLFGAQLFSTREHPGYFFAFSYTYSAVFEGLPSALPQKIRGNLLRVEMRHPFAKRFGFNPSVTYDKSSGVTTVDAVGYARARRTYAGLRLGNESLHAGRGGFFAIGFIGWESAR